MVSRALETCYFEKFCWRAIGADVFVGAGLILILGSSVVGFAMDFLLEAVTCHRSRKHTPIQQVYHEST